MNQIRQKLLITVFIFLSLAAFNLQAAVVEDLFSVELAVADRTTSQRLEVFKQAFQDVLVKVSGSKDVLSHPAMSRPIKSNARYVLQFRYINRMPEAEENFEGGQLYLRVSFNQDAIENLLRSNDISVWGKERPSTLLLISYQMNKNTSIVSTDTTPEIVDELEILSQKHGIPVLFPLLDLEDRQLFGVQDIVNSNQDNIMMATTRYLPDATLVGQISGKMGKGWQASWQLSFTDKLYNWTFNASSHQELLSQAIAQLAQTLAQEYALESVASQDGEILFTVDQIMQLTDHIKVLSYLKSLDAVETVRPVLFSEKAVTYRMKLRNSVEDLSRLIALSFVLEQIDLPQIDAASEDQTVILNYRLIQ